MVKYSGFVILALAVCHATVAGSEEIDEIELMPGEPIVITVVGVPMPESEVPFGVDVVTAEAMALYEPEDIAEAVTVSPGVHVREYGGLGSVSSISVRGGKANETLVMLDGQRINNPQGGDVNVMSVPLEDVERIEVLSGASSALYGADSSAGVVNVVTRGPSERPTFRAKGSYGTYDTKKFEMWGGIPVGPVWFAVGGNYITSDGFRVNPDNENETMDDYEGKTFFGKAVYDLSEEHRLTFRGQYFKDGMGSPGSELYADGTARLRDDAKYFSVGYSADVMDGKISPRAIFYHNGINREYESALFGTFDRHENRFYGANLRNYIAPVGWNRVCVGGEFRRAKTDSTALGDVQENNYAGFVQDEVFAGPVTAVVGLRYDDNGNYGSQVSPRSGIKCRIADCLSVRAAYGEGYRAPTFDELFWPTSAFYEGNPDLKPEKNRTVETGVTLSYPGKGASVELTYFRSDYEDLIVNVTDPETFVMYPDNVSEALVSGVEMGGAVMPFQLFGEGLPLVSVNTSLTYLVDAKDETNDEALDYRPNTVAFAEVAYTLPIGKHYAFTPSVNVRYVGKNQYSYYNPDTYEYEKRFLDPYTLVGMKITGRAFWFEPYVAVRNLAGVEYQSMFAYPMPGRTVVGGVTITY